MNNNLSIKYFIILKISNKIFIVLFYYFSLFVDIFALSESFLLILFSNYLISVFAAKLCLKYNLYARLLFFIDTKKKFDFLLKYLKI